MMNFICLSFYDKNIITIYDVSKFSIFARSTMRNILDVIIEESINRILTTNDFNERTTYLMTVENLPNYCMGFYYVTTDMGSRISVVIGSSNVMNDRMKITISNILRKLLSFNTQEQLETYLHP